jgi:hypothetical protein
MVLTPVDHDPFANAAPAYIQPRDRVFERPEDESLYRQTLARIRAAATNTQRPQLPMAGEQPVDNSEAGMLRRAQDFVIEQRGKEAEEKAFEESRTPVQRVGDMALFMPELAVRTATGGSRGLADIADWAGGPQAGQMVRDTQGNFARANETELEVLKRLGDTTLGIPALSTLGAPLEATAGAALAAARTPRAVLPAEIKSAARGALTDARLEDLAAFERSGVKPFGPAFTETGTAGAVKQLSEAPIVGQPVRNALGRAIEETRDAGERVAEQYGGARTYREAGEAARGGVLRGVEETRDAVAGLPGTGTARSFRDAGNTAEEGLRRFSDARSAETIDTTARELSDVQLGNVVRRPARETSVRTKQDALYERAWRGIPEDMQRGRARTDTSRFLGGFTRTQELLKELSARNSRLYSTTREGEAVNPALSYPVRGGIAGRIVEDIIDGRWRGNLQSMRDVRSSFRRIASGVGDTEANTLQLSDYRRIQSAMTQDMIGLLQRNMEHYAGKGQPVTAARVQRAIHDFRRADQFTRASAQRMEALEKLYGATSPEALARGILADAQGAGRGNTGRLTALRRSLSDDDWNDVAGGILGEMGRPAPTARGIIQEAGFSLNNFVDNLSKLSRPGREALFGHNPELARSLGALEGEIRTGAGPLERLYGTLAPEQIGLEIVKDAQGGTKGGNFARLVSLRRRLNDQEWGNVASAALREMGRPVASARGQTQEAGFSVNSAITRWQAMSPEGRRLLFGDTGGRAQSLADFVRVADRMANFEALANTSRSATNGLGLAGLASIFGAAAQLLMGHPGAAVGTASVGAGMYGFGKFLSSPAYVRWLTRAVRISRDPRAAFTLRDHARELARLAARESDPATEAVARALIVAAGNTSRQLSATPSQ